MGIPIMGTSKRDEKAKGIASTFKAIKAENTLHLREK